MILGIGNDVVYIPRIEKIYQKYGNKFLKKILTVKEIKILVLKSEKQICNHIAKRFAAKEALAKALGTGFRNNISMTDIEIFNDQLGKPYYVLNERLTNFIHQIITDKKFITHLSLSDEYPIAAAFTIIEKLS
jgi:holo-[acyl-carrier protein] synthase